ncbi:MAG: hypothetical protein KGY60_01580 [Bacteroidales bacterium]|nr:hypothetical protein [Bacteroidales bacterium]
MKNLYLTITAIIPLAMVFNFNVEAQQKERKKAIPPAGVGALNTEIEFPAGNFRVKTTSDRTTNCIFQVRGKTPHTLYLGVKDGIGDISVEWVED